MEEHICGYCGRPTAPLNWHEPGDCEDPRIAWCEKERKLAEEDAAELRRWKRAQRIWGAIGAVFLAMGLAGLVWSFIRIFSHVSP